MSKKPIWLAQTNLQFLRQLKDAGSDKSTIIQFRKDYETACLLFGDLIRSSGKPFLCHLVGTASALLLEDMPVTVVRAGLFHAAYTHGRFASGKKGLKTQHREWLVDRIGHESESLVRAFAGFKFDRACVEIVLSEQTPPDDKQRVLLVIRLCNEVDDSLDFAAATGEKLRYRDPTWFDRLQRLSTMLELNFCTDALALHQEETASSDWLQTEDHFEYRYHKPRLRDLLLRAWNRSGD